MTNRENIRNQVFSGLFWKFAERILAQGISFIVSIVLARLLLPEAYGIVAMVMVFINIANVFVSGGISNALIQKHDADETDFSTMFYCSFVIACIIYGGMFVCAPWIADFYNTPELVPVLRVFGIRIILTSYNSIQHAYVSRHMLFRKFFYSTLFGTLISGVVGIFMAYHGFGVWSLVAQYLVNSTIDTMVLMFTIKWKPRLIFSWTSAKNLMSFGWKVLVSNLIGTLYHNLRSLIIGKAYTSADLAFYNRGKNFPDLIMNNVATSITSVLFPAMSNAAGNTEVVKKMTQKSMRITSYVVFPMMLGMAVVARPFTLVLLTDKWSDCIVYMQIVCIYSALHTISQINLQAINAMGRSDIVLKLEFIKKPVGIMMVLLSMPFGVFGVALSLPISAIFTMLVNMQPNRSILNYNMKEQVMDLLPSVVLSVIMGIFIYPISYFNFSDLVTLVLQVFCGVIIYILLSIVTKNESFLYIVGIFKEKKKKKNMSLDYEEVL